MAEVIFAALALIALFALAMNRAPLWAWALGVALFTLSLQLGLGSGRLHAPVFNVWALLGWLVAAGLFALTFPKIKRDAVVLPAYRALKGVMPTISETEREALEAGTVGWDAELFSGVPDWSRLRQVKPITLSPEERAFLGGPTEELCRRLNDWRIRHELRDIPEDIWRFVREQGFLGMLISKEHGGLGFSAQAQSLVLGKISSRSPDGVTIVMVPNSLGPGELIEKYGTHAQQSYYLPRLARGEEIPCFALTGPFSGSDAASMRDVGILTRGSHQGRETLGIRLTWEKRYITLAPKATLLGLAFRLLDPEHHLGRGEDLGITLALVPTNHPGVEIGQRHLPCGASFPNGPTSGRDVFVPLDWIIGGKDGVGQGWRMLMSCLAAGRSISLPATSAAAAKSLLRSTTAYARIRKQFNLPIGFMEGVEEPLARMVETAYALEAARAVTAAMVSAGEKPAVISALLKYVSTERMRQSVNDALDIHGGRGICDGPSNYIQGAYQMVPVGITVEGANILTRNLIVFGQGAIRAHPFLLDEMNALGEADRAKGLDAFDKSFWAHVGHSFKTMFRAWGRSWSGGMFAPAPDAGDATPFYRQLSRYSSAFALCADMALLTLGGALKRKEMLSARFGDILSELYLLSAALKRWQDEGRQKEDFAALEWCMASGFRTIENRFAEILANLPNRFVAVILKFLIQPFGAKVTGPSDRIVQQCAQLVLEPSAARDRLTSDLSAVDDDGGVARLEKAFRLVTAAEDAAKQMRAARLHDWKEAVKKGVITQADGEKLQAAHEAVAKVIEVDDFAPEALSPIYKKPADVHQFFQELGEQRAAS
jgi:acyl-CoA dehydrogenase